MFIFLLDCDKISQKKDSLGTLCYEDKNEKEITNPADCTALGCCFDEKKSKCWVPRGKIFISRKHYSFMVNLHVLNSNAYLMLSHISTNELICRLYIHVFKR